MGVKKKKTYTDARHGLPVEAQGKSALREWAGDVVRCVMRSVADHEREKERVRGTVEITVEEP